MFRRRRSVLAAEEDLNQANTVDKATRNFRLSDFIVKDTLGRGTFSRVRIVFHIMDQAHYALKIARKSDLLKLEQVEHCLSEENILSRVDHPFIVNLLGSFQDDSRVFLVMDYAPGGEIFSLLRSKGKFSNDEARFYAGELVLALEHLHSMNVMYRDIKPENLLLSAAGHLVIVDFGFAKVVTDRTFTVCGTPEYAAPEVILGTGHGMAVDWWSLGVLIFEMCAGYAPFYDTQPYQVYQKILDCDPTFPPDFSFRVKQLIGQLLQQDRRKRLGCGKGGARSVKAHKWFSGSNWDAVYSLQAVPPFEPELASSGDTTAFDAYPDSEEDTSQPLTSYEQDLFAEFGSAGSNAK